MTPTTLSETILKDVPRYRLHGYDAATEPAKKGGIVFLSDVLAALTAALDGVDERATLTVLRLRSGLDNADRGADGERELGGVVLTMNDAADLITALLAQNAALRAARDAVESALLKETKMSLDFLLRSKAAEAVAEKLRGAAQSDADLLFDAYKGLLVLRKMLDVAGLKAGVEAADSLIERMETTHPEMPGRSALRAALTTEADNGG